MTVATTVNNAFLRGMTTMALLVSTLCVLSISAPSAHAQSVVASCGTSADGGAFGFVETWSQLQIEGDAWLKASHGTGAYAELWGNAQDQFSNGVPYYGWYPIAFGYLTYTGQQWTSGVRNYNQPTAEIVVYDGNSNQNAGTFQGLIYNGMGVPNCPYN